MAWLVKHSRSATVIATIMHHGGFLHLVNMMTAEHSVMQNEALVALTLISTLAQGG